MLASQESVQGPFDAVAWPCSPEIGQLDSWEMFVAEAEAVWLSYPESVLLMACERNLSIAMEKSNTTAELWDVSPLPRHSAAATVQHIANALFFTVKTTKAIEKVCRECEPATKRRNYGKGTSKVIKEDTFKAQKEYVPKAVLRKIDELANL